MLLGAIALLTDVLLGMIQGRGTGAFSLVLGASFGSLLGLTMFGPWAALLALSPWPRTASARLGALLAGVLLSPAALLLGRGFYKRIPWSPGDVFLAGAAAVALLLGVWALGAVAGRMLGRHGESMTRRLALLALPLLILCVPAALRIFPALGAPVPSRDGGDAGGNLLLLTVDTLRADRIGAYGAPNVRTPWLDRLARQSDAWTQCVSPSPWTLPSLGSLLTGTYPGEHRVLESLSRISADVPTLAESCRGEGRRTAAFVSNPWLATGSLGRGFDTFDVAERLECLWPLRGTSLYPFLSKAMLRGARLDSADRLSSQAIAWIRNGQGAWFLWVHYFDPHLPNWPGAPWDRLDGPPPSHVGASLTVEEIRAPGFTDDPARVAEVERLYDGEVAFTDRGIGRVLAFLDRTGRRDGTTVVFTADHGEEFWDHGGYGHGHTMHEEVIRVPLLLSRGGSGPSRPRLRPGLARLLDVAPTALSAAGISPDPDRPFSGIDLGNAGVPSTYGEATLYGEEQKYLRTNVWKAVLWPDSGDPGRLEIFDLRSDPGEIADLAPSLPATADSLRVALEEWRERVGSDGAMAARDLPGDLDPSIRDQLEALGYTGN